MKKDKQIKHGGYRPGAGAKPKYSEATTTVAFRIPKSKLGEIKKMVKDKLDEWKLLQWFESSPDHLKISLLDENKSKRIFYLH